MKMRKCLKKKNQLKKYSKMNWWVEPFLILASTITGGISISNFASLLGIPIKITSYAIG